MKVDEEVIEENKDELLDKQNNRNKMVQQWRRNKVEINSMYNNDDIYLTMSHLYTTEILTKSQHLVEQKKNLNYDA